jgi:TonB family protein
VKSTPTAFRYTALCVVALSLLHATAGAHQSSSELPPPFSLSVDVRGNAPESDMRPFVQSVYRRVKKVALDTLPKSVEHGERALVTVQMHIQKDGGLGRSAPLSIIDSSGDKSFEKRAMTAVRVASPFGRLPNSSPVPLELRLTFYYNVAPPPQN